MNPKQFLVIGGIILVVVGILGFVGILGPSEEQSVFGKAWVFDNAENVAHLSLGVIALLAAFALPVKTHKVIVAVVGLLGIFFAIWNLFSETFDGATLQRPWDLLLHLLIGVWALYAALGKGDGVSSLQQPKM